MHLRRSKLEYENNTREAFTSRESKWQQILPKKKMFSKPKRFSKGEKNGRTFISILAFFIAASFRADFSSHFYGLQVSMLR
jgi:hypothetical protein